MNPFDGSAALAAHARSAIAGRRHNLLDRVPLRVLVPDEDAALTGSRAQRITTLLARAAVPMTVPEVIAELEEPEGRVTRNRVWACMQQLVISGRVERCGQRIGTDNNHAQTLFRVASRPSTKKETTMDMTIPQFAPAAALPPAPAPAPTGKAADQVAAWLVEHKGPALVATIAEQIGIKPTTVDMALKTLASRGVARREGTRPALWSHVDAPPPLAAPSAAPEPAAQAAKRVRPALDVKRAPSVPPPAPPAPAVGEPRDASVLELLVHLGIVGQAQVDAARTLLRGAA